MRCHALSSSVFVVALCAGLPNVAVTQTVNPTPIVTDASGVPPDLREAHHWLLGIVDGLGHSAQVTYERVGDVVKFRADTAQLGRISDESIAEGEIVVDVDGLASLRIDRGSGPYRLHRELRARAHRMGLDDAALSLLLEASSPRFPAKAAAALTKVVPDLPAVRAMGAGVVVESAAFEGRVSTAGRDADVGDVTAAWKVLMRTGRGAASRRYELTIEPLQGSIIALERR